MFAAPLPKHFLHERLLAFLVFATCTLGGGCCGSRGILLLITTIGITSAAAYGDDSGGGLDLLDHPDRINAPPPEVAPGKDVEFGRYRGVAQAPQDQHPGGPARSEVVPAALGAEGAGVVAEVAVVLLLLVAYPLLECPRRDAAVADLLYDFITYPINFGLVVALDGGVVEGPVQVEEDEEADVALWADSPT